MLITAGCLIPLLLPKLSDQSESTVLSMFAFFVSSWFNVLLSPIFSGDGISFRCNEIRAGIVLSILLWHKENAVTVYIAKYMHYSPSFKVWPICPGNKSSCGPRVAHSLKFFALEE